MNTPIDLLIKQNAVKLNAQLTKRNVVTSGSCANITTKKKFWGKWRDEREPKWDDSWDKFRDRKK